jgi:hypothetical protein
MTKRPAQVHYDSAILLHCLLSTPLSPPSLPLCLVGPLPSYLTHTTLTPKSTLLGWVPSSSISSFNLPKMRIVCVELIDPRNRCRSLFFSVIWTHLSPFPIECVQRGPYHDQSPVPEFQIPIPGWDKVTFHIPYAKLPKPGIHMLE